MGTKKPRSRLKKISLGVLLLLLMATSLVLIFNRPIAHHVLRDYKPALSRQTVTAAQQKKVAKKDYDWQNVQPLTPQQIVTARFQAQNDAYVGMVAVPDLGINLPISEGTTNTSLSLGAGTLYQQQQMGKGNYALASHFVQGDNNKDLLFSPLYYHGAVGQMIYLTDLNHVYAYQTDTVKVVPADAVNVTAPIAGQETVTLITCDYSADKGRKIMQGHLTKTMTWDETPTDIKAALQTKSQVLDH